MKARFSLHLAAVALLAVLGIAAGCSRAPDDVKIASAIQSSFSSDSGLQGKQLIVQSDHGAVTLSGTVDNDAERQAASRYAAAAPGVKQVINNLQVAGTAGASVAGETSPDQAAPAEQPSQPMQASKPSPGRRRHQERASFSNGNGDHADDAPSTVAHVDQDAQNQAAFPPMNTPAPAMSPALSTPPPPPPPQKVTIPSGTNLAVRLVDPIDSETAQQGQTFHATLNSPISGEGGDVVVPAGYDVEGHVVDVKSAGKFAGKSELTLQLDRISVGSKYYNISTDQYHREGSSRGKNTAEKVGAGGVIGAIIGGIAGGGKGAAIGAAAGGGVGGGVQAASKSQQIKLPSEMVLNFALQSSVTVTPTTKPPHENRPQLDANQNQ